MRPIPHFLNYPYLHRMQNLIKCLAAFYILTTSLTATAAWKPFQVDENLKISLPQAPTLSNSTDELSQWNIKADSGTINIFRLKLGEEVDFENTSDLMRDALYEAYGEKIADRQAGKMFNSGLLPWGKYLGYEYTINIELGKRTLINEGRGLILGKYFYMVLYAYLDKPPHITPTQITNLLESAEWKAGLPGFMPNISDEKVEIISDEELMPTDERRLERNLRARRSNIDIRLTNSFRLIIGGFFILLVLAAVVVIIVLLTRKK